MIERNAAPPDSDVRVPRGKGQMVLTALDAVPEARRLSWRLHRVGSGDNLALIARRFGTGPASILAANPTLDATWFERPRGGEFVLIPTAPRPEPARKFVRATGSHKKSGMRGSTAVARGSAKPATHPKNASHGTQIASASHGKNRRTSSR